MEPTNTKAAALFIAVSPMPTVSCCQKYQKGLPSSFTGLCAIATALNNT